MLDSESDRQRPFLEATWSNICMFNFAVSPDLLEEWVPAPLELDVRDGQALVSLVGLDFEATKVWGIGWPGFRRFPEVNFRFYVRDGERRGVMFMRQFVPQPFVAWMAGLFYREPFESTPMESKTRVEEGVRSVEHRWSYNGKRHELHVEAEDDPHEPKEGSEAYFLTERKWGFAAGRSGGAFVFEVEHPTWRSYSVRSYDYEIDWGTIYGREWEALAGSEPVSVVLAEGSPVKLYSRQPLGD